MSKISAITLPNGVTYEIADNQARNTLQEKADIEDLPTKVSDLYNDSGFISTSVVYSLSLLNNVITLTGSDNTVSSITLPVYSGGVV